MFWWLFLSCSYGFDGEGHWRTIDLPRYRLHYPIGAQAYAQDVARRLEAIRSLTEQAVGRTETRVIDIVVRDPIASPNGSALSLIRHPRMVLYTSPPDSDSVLGYYGDPIDDLVLHEDLHLVHLLSRSRGGWDRFLQAAIGFGPLGRKTPRWLAEGYATLVEGKYTGFGRPNADYRAVYLRTLAVEGNLPTYWQLNGSSRWAGGGDAYLIGSAYLEWLEAREDSQALRELWLRMSAKTNRSFDEAFTGVFGEGPAVLYGTFCAELTREAMAWPDVERTGETFLSTQRSTGHPAISPDGTRLAVVVRTSTSSLLRVYETTEDAKAESRRQEAKKDRTESDPLDVEPRYEQPIFKKLAERNHRSRGPSEPRWVGDELIFTSRFAASDGRLLTDIVIWNPDTGRERRVTHGANIRRVSSAPDGTWAVGVQHRWGETRLVSVDLATGTLRPLTEYGLTPVVDSPRVSPDAARVMYLAAEGKGFRPVFLELSDGTRTHLPVSESAIYSDPEWTDDDHIVVSEGEGGAMEVVEYVVATGERRVLTSTGGRAFNPAVSVDWLYYLKLRSRGFEVERSPNNGLEWSRPTLPLGNMATRQRTLGSNVLTEPPAQVYAFRPYGAGRTEWAPLVSGGITTDGVGQGELGLRFGDVTSRQEGLVLGSFGPLDSGYRGGGMLWTWRQWPIDVTVNGYGRSLGVSQAWGGGLQFDAVRPGIQGAWGATMGAHATANIEGFMFEAMSTLFGRWIEPRSRYLRIGIELRGIASTTGLGAEALAESSIGRNKWFQIESRLGLRQKGMPQYRIGGIQPSYLPALQRWRDIEFPAVSLDVGTGEVLMNSQATLSAGAPGLFIRRLEVGMWDVRQQMTVVGAEIEFDIDREPQAMVPSVSGEVGLGCHLERGDTTRPCQSVDQYAAWALVRWSL